MNRNYDVIVVGAGNGGLACANTLRKAGKNVLLIEKHNIPGGVASSFRRGRFEFEVSLHELCDIGSKENPGGVRKFFEDLGLDLKWCEVPDTFRVLSNFSDGRIIDATMPTGRDNFIDAMEKYAPGNRKQMNDFFDLCEEIRAAVDYTTDFGLEDKKYFIKTFPNFIRTSSYSVNEVLHSLKLTQDAIEILGTYWSYLGIDCDHLSFMHYAIMIILYIERNAYIPQETSHGITLALADKFIENGGTLLYNTTCEQVLFDENKCVRGIKTNDGEFYAPQVVMNANHSMVYAKMIPSDILPIREVKLANARKFSSRPVVVYLGLNKSKEELGINDYTFIYPSTMDSHKEFESMKSLETNSFGIAICPNVVNEYASPKGTSIITITSLFMENVWDKIEVEDYFNTKEKFAEHLIDIFEEKTGIKIKDYIEEIEISTPWTYFRYASTPEGAAYGYETKDWDSLLARLLMYEADYQIKGLRFVGGSIMYGDGYSVAYSGGKYVANVVLKDLEAN